MEDSEERDERASDAAPRQLQTYASTTRKDWQDEPGSTPEAAPARPWRGALTRWLLALNPGRTQDEYEKAVRYFFETPGAPQDLAALTPDLLLAYRGALANRADRRRRSTPRRKTTFADRLAAQSGPLASPAADAALGTGAPGVAPGGQGRASATIPAAQRKGPLSPATVNIRLTALRQYLLFAHEQEPLPALSAERIRSALRRLTNERRRPYQILAEDEWEAFLGAALGPQRPPTQLPVATPAPEPTPNVPAAPRSGPWGKTRAAREQERRAAAEAWSGEQHGEQANDDDEGAAAPHVTRTTRTGAYTAQRDHALISLALATGLRAIELSLLDVGDLVNERRRGALEWWLVLPDEKTKGQRGGRTLPLAPELAATLHDYIRATGRRWDDPRQRATPLFLALTRGRYPQRATEAGAGGQEVVTQRAAETPTYRRLRPEQIRSVIHRVERQWLAQQESEEIAEDGAASAPPGGRRLSPHALRHSAAIALLLGDEAGERPPASVEHVRGWLGHFDIRTTQRYLAHIESRDQRRRFAIRPPQRRRGDAPDQVSQADQSEGPPAQDNGA